MAGAFAYARAAKEKISCVLPGNKTGDELCRAGHYCLSAPGRRASLPRPGGRDAGQVCRPGVTRQKFNINRQKKFSPIFLHPT